MFRAWCGTMPLAAGLTAFALALLFGGAPSWCERRAHATPIGLVNASSTRALTVGAVASEHEIATRLALRVLRKGGSAADAAITAALVLGVVAPSSCGLGGGGFALSYRASNDETDFLDFRERAPKQLVPSLLESQPLSFELRGRAVGVPGEPSGLYELHRKHGKLAFSTLAAVAQKVANDGFYAGPHLLRTLGQIPQGLARQSLLLGLEFAPSTIGAKAIRRPRLAKTLEKYGKQGPSAITSGSIAEGIVAATRAYDGRITEDDLRSYRPVSREPLRARFGRFTVVTAPPPSAGGVLLLQTLGKFAPEQLARHRSTAERTHLLAEAYRQSFADRMAHLGDPDLLEVSVRALLDPTYLEERERAIRLDRTELRPLALPNEQGTCHTSVLDRDGNAVALTTTVNNGFGSRIVERDSGILLNDELYDFGDLDGPNAPRALARPVSSMTPTLVFEGPELRYVLGGSGGMAIPTNVTTTLISLLVDGASPEVAIEQPRFTLVPNSGALILEEAFSVDAVRGLTLRGEQVSKARRGLSAVQVIAQTKRGTFAAADSRKHGVASAQ